MIVYGGYLTYEYFIKGTEKNDPKPAFGKIRNIYRNQCALHPDHTGRFESNGSGTRNLIHPEPADCYFRHRGNAWYQSHRGLLSVDLYSLTDPLGTEYRSVKDRP